MDNAHLRCQIKQLGNAAPADTDEGILPESLREPPVEDTGDMVARSYDQQDDKYQHTAKIASDVRRYVGIHEKPKGCIPIRDGRKGSQNLAEDPPSPGPFKEHEVHLSQAEASGVPAAWRSMRANILLVEDNIINQKVVYRKLMSKGYKVTTANNGREAVESVRSAPKRSSGDKRAFDICLMDMEMPIMDGNTATRSIRELERQGEIEHIPILGVTANVRGEQQTEM